MQKRLQVQESLGKPIFRKRVLRLFFSNTAANQNLPPPENSTNPNPQDLPSWTLRIEGRFLDVVDENYKNKPAPRKFSEQFSSILIELDRKNHPQHENIIEWRHSPQSEPVDGFEIKRLGNENVPIRISFHLRHSAKKFKINNNDLASLLNISSPITKVSLIFGDVPILFSSIPELLAPFCSPIDPIVLFYTIKVDSGTEYKPPYAYDLNVEVEEPIRSRLGILPSLQTGQKDLASIEEKQQKLIQAIYNSRTKRDFLKGFCLNPAEFVNTLVENMAQDLLVITGEHKPGLELANSTNSDLFGQAWTDEAVLHYLIENERNRLDNSLVAETANLASSASSLTSSNNLQTPAKPVAQTHSSNLSNQQTGPQIQPSFY
ncbi:SWI/SNF-related matrix-associated actin-dependent regulator of chromatin subfamily D member 3 [Smittium culicis]|uniref:SWI/SNF-related matrix-associated actin-dependent regulator of chromatin subfamily D member 3 n=1 Tax=Smittium culicis TaxID=133412 RepID=A0A1R1XPA6_9FUNG|nr:SWI/SNF-related matrix-associated actin-dependent regulator of chromatin subfamily D member 3 [Smittium culicis]